MSESIQTAIRELEALLAAIRAGEILPGEALERYIEINKQVKF